MYIHFFNIVLDGGCSERASLNIAETYDDSGYCGCAFWLNSMAVNGLQGCDHWTVLGLQQDLGLRHPHLVPDWHW